MSQHYDDLFEDNVTSISEVLWPTEHKPFTPKFLQDFATLQNQQWLIKQIIPKQSLVVIYGAPGSGKTFAALDMGMAIARANREWSTHRIKQGRVVYICAEGKAGFKNRIMAYMLHHNLQFDETPNFQVIDEVPNLISQKDPQEITQSIGKADLIIFDTLACVIPGGDENAAKDMSMVISHCKTIIEKTGATVALIHHSGKVAENGARGWSGLLGAVDTEIRVEALGTAHTLTVTKQKEGEAGKSYGFYLPVYDLGTDEDGDPITSCYFEHSDVKIPSKLEKKDKLGSVEILIIECFDEFHLYEVDVEELRRKVIVRLDRGDSERDLRPQRFKNSVERLQEKGLFYINNQKIYKK